MSADEGLISPPPDPMKRDGKQVMKTRINRFYKVCWPLSAFCLLWLCSQSALADTLVTSVDRTQIGSGETVELQVKYDGQTTGEPNFSILEQNFEILSRDRQNQISYNNGNLVSYTEWRLQLWPKKTGKLIIPSLSLKGEQSRPITLQVEDQPTTGQHSEPVYLETELDKQTAYVQEQLLLTLRIVSSTNLQGISSEELMLKDASVTKVAESQYQKRINGINHLVIELKYALFPSASGELTIPSVRFSLVLPDRRDPFSGSFFSRGGKRLFLSSEQQNVIIKPKPAGFGSSDWLPSQGIGISERWSRPVDELVAGEPITRTILVTAQGLTSAQLPPLEIQAGKSFKVYPDQPQMSDDVSESGVTGTRTESVAIVPSRGGTISLPPVVVKWWDTRSNEVKETTLAGTTLTVKPAANTPDDLYPAQNTAEQQTEMSPAEESSEAGIATPFITKQSNEVLVWVLGITNLVLAAIVIVLLFLWRQAKAMSSGSNNPAGAMPATAQKESELFKQLRRASKGNDYRHFRETLMAWASAFWQHPLVTLSEITRLSNTPSLQPYFDQLDKTLYQSGNAGDINLNSLCEELSSVRKTKKEKPSQKNHLKPLYNNR
jgi:hypothetical protein